RYAKPIPARVTTAPAILLGIGLGGFIDGIVLHQVLQWHSMLSNVVPLSTIEAMHLNMFWDGVFHAATWVVTFVGVMLLWRSGQRGTIPPVSVFLGGMLLGWGAFNLVEGLINHHLLELHNVREVMAPTVWNVGFLALSVVISLLGLVLVSRRPSRLDFLRRVAGPHNTSERG
ncbi:MAG TPA: DUF2243 domain-containing protein, partial [Burkholderiaceae bacterium]|nr:DUF2243 domain-containing protein [Burkholderiaceae bacterium]